MSVEHMFRNLHPAEIDCKAEIVNNKIEVSLHIKAHVCTSILNETVGYMGWEKEYTNGNKNCIVRIWDKEKGRMISKEDCGGPLTEIDGHKGQASNGFKRVCALGWGLGIELYSQPKIVFPIMDSNITYDSKGKMTVSEKYSIKEIQYDDNKNITRCVVIDSKKRVVYDGPNESGESDVEYPIDEDDSPVIPQDEDVTTEDCGHEYDELPDNTDGLVDDIDVFATKDDDGINIDYLKEIEKEIDRTHVKRSDVLNFLKISSMDDINQVDEILLDETIRKLKALKTYSK